MHRKRHNYHKDLFPVTLDFFFKKGYLNLSFDIKVTSPFAALNAALLSKLHSKTIHLCFQLSALKLWDNLFTHKTSQTLTMVNYWCVFGWDKLFTGAFTPYSVTIYLSIVASLSAPLHTHTHTHCLVHAVVIFLRYACGSHSLPPFPHSTA